MPDGTSDYVRYASYAFISEYRNVEGRPPSGVMYNKFMTLLNRGVLKDLDEDMHLPHCWYRWGDEVVRYGLDYLSWFHGDPRETLVSYVGVEPTPNPDDPIYAYTDSFVEGFVNTYSGREGVEMAIDMVYSDAPFEFQNRFRMLRENLRISMSNVTLTNHHELIGTLFENAMDVFPHDEFPHVTEQTKQFETVFSMAVERGVSISRLKTISETYWFLFCYHLRLHERCHANVPALTLELWRHGLSENHRDYDEMIQTYANYVAPRGCDDPVILDLRSRRQERLDGLKQYAEEGDFRDRWWNDGCPHTRHMHDIGHFVSRLGEEKHRHENGSVSHRLPRTQTSVSGQRA